MKKAISVFSGGLDCTVATCVFNEDYDIHAITFNYGQKAFRQEVKASKNICKKMGWSHEVIDLPWLADISNSSLNTGEDIPEVSVDDLDDLDKSGETAERYLQRTDRRCHRRDMVGNREHGNSDVPL